MYRRYLLSLQHAKTAKVNMHMYLQVPFVNQTQKNPIVSRMPTQIHLVSLKITQHKKNYYQ